MKKKIVGVLMGLTLSLGICITANAEQGSFTTKQQPHKVKQQNISLVKKASTIRNGWWDLDYGNWAYVRNGEFVFNDWAKIDSNWYYFNQYGYMVRDVSYYIDGEEYFFNGNGTLARNKWTKVIYNGNYEWIYSDSSGVMKKSSWVKDNGNWYYLDYNGVMIQGEVYIVDGIRYFFKNNGIMAKNGWATDGEDWFYTNSSGQLYINRWLQLNGKWYCFDMYGYMVKDCIFESNGESYYFDVNGFMKTGWIKIDNEYYGSKIWMYASASGCLHTNGWRMINNNWYYFKDLQMVADTWIDNQYYVDSSGAMAKGWKSIKCDYGQQNHSFYFGKDGKLVKNQQIGDYWVNEYGYYGDNAHDHNYYSVG